MCICILAVATIVVDDDDDDKWTEFYIFFFCILLLLLYFKLAQATHPSSSFMACHRHVIKLPSSTTTSPHHPCHCSPLANICNCLCQSVLFVCLSVCLSLCVFHIWIVDVRAAVHQPYSQCFVGRNFLNLNCTTLKWYGRAGWKAVAARMHRTTIAMV